MQHTSTKIYDYLKRLSKAQSATEYLMTYSWAILIIAIILIIIFRIGIFNYSSLSPQTCIAESGYYCHNIVLLTNGTLSFTIGQMVLPSIKNVDVYFVPANGNLDDAAHTYISTFENDQIVNIKIQLPTTAPYPSSYSLGTSITGQIYISYTIGGITHYTQIASLSTKSSGSGNVIQPLYIPITLTNSQTSNTPAPFQQMINITESNYAQYITYNSNFADFEYTYLNGTIIPAWIESNQTGNIITWLNLKKGISANSNIIVDLKFEPNTNLLSSSGTSGIGEAPQLSSTYAEYDDGGDVFNFYSNFRGNTLNTSKWKIYGAPSITIDNGLTLAATSGSWMGIYNSIFYNPQLYINDFYAYFTGLDSSNGGPTKTIGWEPGGLAEPSYNLGDASTTDYTLWNYNNNGAATTITGGTTSTYQIWNLWTTSTASYLSLNYGIPVSSSTDFTASTSSEIGIGGAINTGESIKVQWFRLRAYPPDDTMPKVKFGNIN